MICVPEDILDEGSWQKLKTCARDMLEDIEAAERWVYVRFCFTLSLSHISFLITCPGCLTIKRPMRPRYDRTPNKQTTIKFVLSILLITLQIKCLLYFDLLHLRFN